MFTRKDVEGVLQKALGLPAGAVLRVRLPADEAEQFVRHVGAVKGNMRTQAKAMKAPNWDETPYDRLVLRRGPEGVAIHRLAPVNTQAARATLEAAATVLEALGGQEVAEIVQKFARETSDAALISALANPN